jgi:molybdopterin-synthase adenylyltransferase
MDYSLSLTRHAAQVLRDHLLGDRSREQMAVTLCGVNRLHRELRLLVRDVILLPPDAFRQQTAAHLELKREVQTFLHHRAHRHGLIQVDWHSHPGRGPFLAFSPTDDRHEAAQAAYLAHRMDGVPYGSVVINDNALDARLWLTRASRQNGVEGRQPQITYRPEAYPVRVILAGDLQRHTPLTTQRLQRAREAALSPVYDRQVRAFGPEFQHKVGQLRIGLVGLGGLGSAIAEQLGRIGIRDWVLVDPDTVDLTNLNRLVHATLTDAQKARPKVYVARSSIRQSNPKARVRALQTDAFDPEALHTLKACDLLVVATDNHASRMALNRLAVQYLIPLLHVGFNISVEEPQAQPGQVPARAVTDVSGEFALPDLGRWCLQCAGLVDPQQAGWELAPAAQRQILRQRGYVADTPAPAVRHLDGLVAALATTEVHNLVHSFKPQHRYLTYDALRTELLSLQVTPSDGCPVCSPDHGVLGLGDLEPLPDYRRAGQAPRLPPPASPPSTPPGGTGLPASQSASLELVAPLPEPVPAATPPDRPARVRRLQTALEEAEADWP